MQNTDDLRITEGKEIPTPDEVHSHLPITEEATQTIVSAREDIRNILTGADDRLLVVVGPCSIHHKQAAHDYANALKKIKDKLRQDLLIVMRVYFEKPRTTVGWKGLINDPDLDESFDIIKGLHAARELLLDVNSQGIPAATEYLDLITPQYISDLISWGAIGARTTESQVHRELASGLSCPVGFKNATDGSIKVAIDAILAAKAKHHFLSVKKNGRVAIFSTQGNDDTHIILRGGNDKPNYDAKHVHRVAEKLKEAELPVNIMIDFSHANCSKNYKNQLDVVGEEVSKQIAEGNQHIIGVMIESHIKAGRQDLIKGVQPDCQQSITDACLGWDDTERLLHKLADAVQHRRQVKN
jgi:3-deoxy-7-phosphoheptulonate synthase